MSAADRMMTDLERLDVDLERHVALVYMGEHTCTDMSGAIAVVTEIDPECQTIVTIAGAEIDTAYVRYCGKWRAIDTRRLMP